MSIAEQMGRWVYSTKYDKSVWNDFHPLPTMTTWIAL
jgi:hypothetical protein